MTDSREGCPFYPSSRIHEEPQKGTSEIGLKTFTGLEPQSLNWERIGMEGYRS